MSHGEHDGPCKLGLGFIGTDPTHDAATFLERAIDWSRGLDEFDVERPLAEAVLQRWRAEGRQIDPRRAGLPELHLDVTPDELEAVREIVREAKAYWVTNDYGSDIDPDDDTWLVNDSSAGDNLVNCGADLWRRSWPQEVTA